MTSVHLRATRLPSGWSPLELVNHLAHMERRRLRWGFLAEQLPDPLGEQTRAIVAAPDLSDVSAVGGRFAPDDPKPRPTLAWILMHVLQEYARHAGHLDAVRELIDGTTGE
ncbi:DinB family protein [Kitasatospora paracochleata]|uniref:DUF664 domain-containing protein n=1 Tax=Kitasatospora paracochleata TaxID=58354 RepID=A0ABT1J1I4_9ACTN|nr:DUF664 domain-containing protein [Kitasatospora paracochleata]MCP2311104.1 hypothetical protein [Kitasatospora paracochleata]